MDSNVPESTPRDPIELYRLVGETITDTSLQIKEDKAELLKVSYMVSLMHGQEQQHELYSDDLEDYHEELLTCPDHIAYLDADEEVTKLKDRIDSGYLRKSEVEGFRQDIEDWEYIRDSYKESVLDSVDIFHDVIYSHAEEKVSKETELSDYSDFWLFSDENNGTSEASSDKDQTIGAEHNVDAVQTGNGESPETKDRAEQNEVKPQEDVIRNRKVFGFTEKDEAQEQYERQIQHAKVMSKAVSNGDSQAYVNAIENQMNEDPDLKNADGQLSDRQQKLYKSAATAWDRRYKRESEQQDLVRNRLEKTLTAIENGDSQEYVDSIDQLIAASPDLAVARFSLTDRQLAVHDLLFKAWNDKYHPDYVKLLRDEVLSAAREGDTDAYNSALEKLMQEAPELAEVNSELGQDQIDLHNKKSNSKWSKLKNKWKIGKEIGKSVVTTAYIGPAGNGENKTPSPEKSHRNRNIAIVIGGVATATVIGASLWAMNKGVAVPLWARGNKAAYHELKSHNLPNPTIHKIMKDPEAANRLFNWAKGYHKSHDNLTYARISQVFTNFINSSHPG